MTRTHRSRDRAGLTGRVRQTRYSWFVDNLTTKYGVLPKINFLPIISCMKHEEHITLTCYAEGRANEWEAVCLDFDIAVQAPSFEEVYSSLNTAIDEYVSYVMTLPKEERKAFLHRRAPLSLRFKFLWHALRATFFGRSTGGKERAEFMLPCSV